MNVDLGPVDDLPDDSCLAVADGAAVAVRIGEEVRVFANRCLHQDSPLAGGWVRDGVLSCPHHFWRYEVADGSLVGGAGDLTAYPAEIIDGHVIADIPETVSQSFRQVMLNHAREWNRDD